MFRELHLSVTLLLAVFVSPAAQISHQPPAATSPGASKPLPFRVGETLSYDVRFSKLIFSGAIGELKLAVSAPGPQTEAETSLLELKAEALSRGFFPALFGVKVRDRYTSLVSRADFGLLTSTRLLEEGKVRREQQAVVDREAGRVTFTDRDLAHAKSEPKVKEKPSPRWIQDMLSTIYYVRTQPLKDGDVIAVPISDGGEVYNIEVVAQRREQVKTRLGKFDTVQLNAKVFDGRFIKRSGEMLVWVTDDEARIPLRARVKTSGYTITVELKRMPKA